MRALLTTVILIGLSLQCAYALQTCPAGNPRIAPDSRYIDNGNGTLTDSQTGLIWKQCSEGQSGTNCSGTPNLVTWVNALSAGANSSFAGFNDWRLPNAKELRSLVETACHTPAINELRFPNTPSNFYWTSSTYSADSAVAGYIDFGSGNLNNLNKSNNSFHVRLVRGGP